MQKEMILVSKTNLFYCPFVHLSIVEAKLCQKQRPKTVFHILTVPRVTSSFHEIIFVYSIRWEKHLLCFGNYNLTSILQVSISHKMYM